MGTKNLLVHYHNQASMKMSLRIYKTRRRQKSESTFSEVFKLNGEILIHDLNDFDLRPEL